MKQVVQNFNNGKLWLEDTPVPSVRAGMVMVKTAYSVISAGTERSKVTLARKSLIGKARLRPDLVAKVLATARKEGIGATFRKVTAKLNALSPLGYSSSGTVVAVGAGVTSFHVGDRVSCAGAEFAHHAEVVCVPENLCCRVPAEVNLDHAALTTIGAIALHGVRQSSIALGEAVAVVGLGLLGQIAVQLLKASGCRVIGVDVDRSRVDLAVRLGADIGLVRGEDDVESLISSFTGGYGVDVTILTAATRSADPVITAGIITRDRGRVVVVGDVNLTIPRDLYYQKELELRLSRSYGPGRYDPEYEVKGHDYPFGYVRWTEKRNMQEFLRLLEIGAVDLAEIISHRFQLSDVQLAYDVVSGKAAGNPLGVLLEYPGTSDKHVHSIELTSSVARSSRSVGLGVIGAGSFAQGVLLPHFRASKDVAMMGVVTSNGVTSRDVAEKFGFSFCSTDPGAVLGNPDVNAVVIATRHDSHSRLVRESLRADKHVYVEKPLALSEEGLREVVEAWNGTRILMVGFNRRFSPHVKRLVSFFGKRVGPMVLDYRINAGTIDRSHWVQDPQVGGGRVIGEVCHFIDLCRYLVGKPIVSVYAVDAVPATGESLVDNVLITLSFQDGSIANIMYVSNGDRALGKEFLTITADGRAAVLDDYRRLALYADGEETIVKSFAQDKGHGAEISEFLRAVKDGTSSPVPIEESVEATRVSFAVLSSITSGQPVRGHFQYGIKM